MAGRVVGKTFGLNLELLRRLQRVADARNITISVTSGYRSIEEQRRLYNLYLAGRGNLAARPGASFHNYRGAADTAPRLRDGQLGVAARAAGLIHPVPGEPWHCQRKGMSKPQAAAGPYYTGGAIPGAFKGPDARTTKVVQRQLYDLGFAPDGVERDRWADGVWGPKTAAALKRAQRAYSKRAGTRIATNGVWGAASRRALDWLHANAPGATRGPRILRHVKHTPMRGQDVREWQRELCRFNPARPVQVDGLFGPETHERTVEMQRQVGVTPDGIVSARTRDALTRAVKDRELAPTPQRAAEASAHGRPRYYTPADTTAAVSASDGGTITGGPFKVVLHSTESRVYQPSSGDYYGHQSYPHLTLADVDGRWRFYQHIPFDRAAKALRNRPGGVESNRDSALQVEIAWTADDMANLPQAALDLLRDWIVWCADEFGVQLQSPEFAGPEAYGDDGVVRMSPSQWDAFDGVCGHQHVPEGNLHWDPGQIDIDHLLRPADAGPLDRPAPPASAPAPQPVLVVH